MIVLKFGGTSVQDAASMNQALDIVTARLADAPLMVSSAMSGVTNALVSLTQALAAGDVEASKALVASLEARHLNTLSELAEGELAEEGRRLLGQQFTDLGSLVKGSLLLKDCSARVQDAIWGMGELLATTLLWVRARQRGVEARLYDARQFIITDTNFGEAAVLWEQTQRAVSQKMHLEPGVLGITQGFIGATEGGVSTVLGRGGSDYSGALFGAALGASGIEIWTDVDGIMTTDPRKVANAQSIPFITYAEAAELAFFGAKVVHPATIQPAVEKQIPVWVKNTKNPSHPGTRIGRDAAGTGLRAIAGRKGVTVVTVSSSRMLNAYGFLKRIFEIFDRHQVSVDLVATSEVSVSMTVEDKRDLAPLVADLQGLGAVRVDEDSAILCLVGQDVWKDNRRIAKVFEAIPDVPLRLISLGSSEINLSVVVRATDLDRAVSAIHDTFFGPGAA